MKRNILKPASIALVIAALSITGCTKDDLTAPTITLKGNSTETIVIGTAYSDAGATANDDQDGDISDNITVAGLPTGNTAGTFTVTYSVSDAAGNTTEETRTVIVKIINSSLAGIYNGTETCTPPPSPSSPYNPTISASSSNQVDFSIVDLGKFSTPLTVTATLSGTTGQAVTIPAQTTGGVLFTGSGTISDDGKVITYTYSATDNAGTQSCTGTLTKQ